MMSTTERMFYAMLETACDLQRSRAERAEREVKRLQAALAALQTNEYDHSPSDVPDEYLPEVTE